MITVAEYVHAIALLRELASRENQSLAQWELRCFARPRWIDPGLGDLDRTTLTA